MSLRNLKSSFNNGKLIALKIDGTGTAKVTGPDANRVTLTDNGVGDYSITLNTAASEAPFICGIFPVTEDVVITQQTNPTTSVVRFTARSLPVAEKVASLTLDDAISFYATVPGTIGNNINLALVDAVSAGSEAVVSVSGEGSIVINIEEGVTTATQLQAALMNSDSDLAESVRNFLASVVTTGATAITSNNLVIDAAAVDATANTFTSTDHGLVTGDAVYVVEDNTLPTGLSDATVYYAIKIDDDIFKLSLTNGGAAIDISDVGTLSNKYVQVKFLSGGVDNVVAAAADCDFDVVMLVDNAEVE